jgi:ppGpp synthetase/RelA/SpoT-type nucleotidyltranferase
LRPVASVTGEMKTFKSFADKALRYQDEGRADTTAACFAEIGDIVRARVTCQTLSDVERLRTLLGENQAILVGGAKIFDFKDRTSTGYRALHLNAHVEVPEGNHRVAVPCEVQIHTSLQYAWGLYTHKDFYKGDDVPGLVRELMIQLSDLLHVADHVADELIREVERIRAT